MVRQMRIKRKMKSHKMARHKMGNKRTMSQEVKRLMKLLWFRRKKGIKMKKTMTKTKKTKKKTMMKTKKTMETKIN